MGNILGQSKELVELLDTKVGRLEVALVDMSENLEEVLPVWGSLVEQFFNGDDVGAILVIVMNLILSPIQNIRVINYSHRHTLH